MAREKMTVLDLQEKKAQRQPITMLTAYDYPTALLVDQAGIDIILVGDSVGMVVLGYETTVPVTMNDMVHHCQAVSRGADYALLVGDMPFMSYQAETAEAVRNAGRLLKQGNMDVVKLEGGKEVVPTAEAIVGAGIAVMGHIGLTPQSVGKLGGFKVQGRSQETAQRLLDDAKALEDAGCFSIILEAIPGRVAELITEEADIPTIGIGAGPHCDGQVLVTHDLIGLFDRFTPRFVKQYANVFEVIEKALAQYREEVLNGTFPGPEHSFTIKDEELEGLY